MAEQQEASAVGLKYIRYLEEARRWMGQVLECSMPSLVEFENRLENGVLLCKLGEKYTPDATMWKKVYDKDEARFEVRGVDYRHTDNINFFLTFLKNINFPKVFHPNTFDVYQQRNMAKLVSCLHALSHFLKRKGFTKQVIVTVEESIQENDESWKKTTLKKTTGMSSKEIETIGMAKELIHEELQYQEMGIEDDDTECSTSETGETDLYDTIQGLSVPQSHSVIAMESRETLMAYLNTKTSAVFVKVFEKSSEPSPITSTIETLLNLASAAVSKGKPETLLKVLSEPNLFLGDVLLTKEAGELYLRELEKIVSPSSQPKNVLYVYSGLSRDMCDKYLQKMSPGAFIVRESVTSPEQYVFSFRNQTGIKHWQIKTLDGKYFWGTSPMFPSLDAFTQNFSMSLKNCVNLNIHQGFCTELEVVGWQNNQKLQSISDLETTFTIKQLQDVVDFVGRKLEMESLYENTNKYGTLSWDHSMVLNVTRQGAEKMLHEHGESGSFLVRPSEKDPSDFAIVFRAGKEIRNWKITRSNHNTFFVKPYPESFSSIEEVIDHFVSALSDTNDVPMKPLILPKQVLDELFGYESVPKGGLKGCREGTAAAKELSKQSSFSGDLQPIPLPRSRILKHSNSLDDSIPTSSETITNGPSTPESSSKESKIRKWSTSDIVQWLDSAGLGQFSEAFVKHAIDGECLLSLSQSDLKEDMGIQALGHRHRILRAIKHLREDVNN